MYTAIGIALATAFGIGTVWVLGTERLAEQTWVDPIFWGLIVAGPVLDYWPQFRAWFGHQSDLVQNLVAATGFLALTLMISLLLKESDWVWYIAG